MEVKVLKAEDEIVLSNVAPGVFDNEIIPELAAQYLQDPRHHLIVVIDRGTVVGFISAVDYFNPNKPPELWLNEIAIAPSHQRQGLGKKLLEAMLERGREIGCREAWVLTAEGNVPARALYSALGGAESPSLMISYKL